VVIYARVSSKEQEKEGFSIPAQLKLLREYAAEKGFEVAQEYVDVETAKQTGRAAFGEMVAYLKAHCSVRAILVEKTDRLYRNFKDWVTLDELDVELHFPKEGQVISRSSRSSEKFMHGIKVLMAKNYLDNLAEEARKGMQEKAEQGIWPTKCPLGYRNVAGPDGKKIIATDPTIAPLIAKLFEWYARGESTRRRSSAIKPNTSDSMSAFTPCTSISSMAWSIRHSSKECRTSGAKSRTVASAKSNCCKRPIAHTWTKGLRFSNWRRTRKCCSRSKDRVKNAAY
jgi:DNA invertase Pin-like site-specific DNA recombinase